MDMQKMLILAVFAIAVVIDLRTARFPNVLMLAFALMTTLSAFLIFKIANLDILSSIATAFGIGFLGYALGVVGAGDGKLMISVAPLMTVTTVWQTYVASLFFAALIGLTFLLLKRKKIRIQALTLKDPQVTRIPYTAALILGWLSLQNLSFEVSL